MITAPATGGYYNPNYGTAPKKNPNQAYNPLNPPAKPPSGDYDPFKDLPFGKGIDYRGGEHGVQSDFGMRDNYASKAMDTYFAGQMGKQQSNMGLRNSILGSASGAMSNAMRDKGMGYLDQGMDALNAGLGQYGASNDFFQNLMRNGGFAPGQMDKDEAAMRGEYVRAGEVQGDNINNAMAARGAAASPLAGAAMRLRAAMDGAGAAGRLGVDLRQQQRQNMAQGAQGHASNANAMAQLQQAIAGLMGNKANIGMQQTQEGMMDFLKGLNLNVDGPDLSGGGAMYDQLRNLAIGPGAGLQPPNSQPNFNPRGAIGAPRYING